jgi:hypothetical protein
MKLDKLLFVVENINLRYRLDRPNHSFTLALHDLELEYDVKAHLSETKPWIFDAISKELVHAYENGDVGESYIDKDGKYAVKYYPPVLRWSLARSEYDELEMGRKCTIVTKPASKDEAMKDDFGEHLDVIFS